MPAGIRVTVEFPAPPVCPIADLSARADTVVSDVSTSVATDDGSVTEFLVDADAVPEDYDADLVFTYADRNLYRVRHDDADCPCACLGEFDTPVDRYFAQSGALQLVFHAREFEELQEIVGELRERFPEVDIQRFVRAPTEAASRDAVFVDRSTLTERQLEVLQTAYEMGYFERPRGANASEVAETLDVSPSTITEHLLAAQRKIFADVLEDEC